MSEGEEMAFGIMPQTAEVGQYIKVRGHKIHTCLYLQWWKITAIEDGTIYLRDRHGATRRLNINIARRNQWRLIGWEPGDSREDETE
jgi:hypothetical protein